MPSCQSCNSARKREKELEGGINLWLEEIKRKKQGILKRAAKLRSDLLLDLPGDYKEFFLSSPDFLLSDLIIESIQKRHINIYKTLAFSPNLYPLHLTSPNSDDKTELITNLIQYEFYRDKGYYGYNTPEIDLCSFFDACLLLFKKFESAQVVKSKFALKDYYCSLPARALHVIGPDEDSIIEKYDTIGEYINGTNTIAIEKTDFVSKFLLITQNSKKKNTLKLRRFYKQISPEMERMKLNYLFIINPLDHFVILTQFTHYIHKVN